MNLTNDRTIRVSRGETVRVRSSGASLIVEGSQAAGSQELSLTAPAAGEAIVLHAASTGPGTLALHSSSGEEWSTSLAEGTSTFEFVLEPAADEWHCEFDDGDPVHPVSKGDTVCPYCGGRVLHDGK
jgi:hypothetical protein